MDYQIMKAKTHGYILNANDMIDIYNKTINNERQLKKLEDSLERWLELLETDGIDSKNMVATDIQQLLEEIGK